MTTEETNSTELDDEKAIFKGLKFFLSGRLTNLQEETLVKHGGEKIEYFSDYVKICIVGEDPLETDLTDAKEIYEVPAVRQDWVSCSLHMKKQLDPKPFEIDNILLKDIVLHCSGLSEEDMFTVLSVLFINGGAFEKDLNSEKVTHLICNVASGPKYEYVLENRANIHLITPDWLMFSVERKQLQPEVEFHPRLLILPKPPPSSPKPHQDLGDLSSITGFDDVGLPAEGQAPLGSGPEHPNLQQLKQRFPWMSPSSPSHSPIHSQVSGAISSANITTLSVWCYIICSPSRNCDLIVFHHVAVAIHLIPSSADQYDVIRAE
uniref:PAX-interacting protein 1 n=1 Tax=Cacopsylla melanoneura TaxID=428564 RepID=A0A8D8S037_9HEMI